jgi:hypothetical protein
MTAADCGWTKKKVKDLEVEQRLRQNQPGT